MNPTNCKACGSALPEGAIICPSCGKPTEEALPTGNTPTVPMSSEPVTFPAPAFDAPPAAPPAYDAAPSSFGAPPAPVQPVVPTPGSPYGAASVVQYGAAPGIPAPMAPGAPAPYGQPIQPGAPVPMGFPGQAPFPVAKKFSGNAIAALVIAIIGFFRYGIMLGALATILSIVALATFNASTQKGRGFAIAGLVIGIIDLFVLFL